MPETGGPTTQSGILFQNSIAALFLGRLCDVTSRPEYEKVTKVRVETLDYVDDIVVTFSDNHNLFIQAKEDLAIGKDAWIKLWKDFEDEFKDPDFIKDKDKMSLFIGNYRDDFNNLREICERSISSKSYDEWQTRLNKDQKFLLEKIKGILHPEHLRETTLLSFFQHIIIEIHQSQNLLRDVVCLWMPSTNYPPRTLFSLLRDKVGGESRIRGEFSSNSLQKQLICENPGLIFNKPLDIEFIKESILTCSSLLRQQRTTIGSNGFHFSRRIVSEIVEWASTSTEDMKNVAMLVDQAGTGKTVVLHDVQIELESKGIFVLAIKADQQLSGISQISEINTYLGLSQSPEQILERLAQLNRVVVLVDQIDALSLTLAHNQASLDVVLDFISRLRRIPNLRILISCRLFDRNNDQRLRQIEIPKEFSLGKLTDDEIKTFIDSAGVSYQNLSEPTKFLLQTPLHLNLFALALEEDSTLKKRLFTASSLQELYGTIWDSILLREDTKGPSKTDRLEVIRLFTNYMIENQVISMPKTQLLRPEHKHLEKTVKWLASVGLITESINNWVFIHQTFFDYCFARDFVENGKNLINVIQQSDQGLFIRPLLLQVLIFMRGTKSKQYFSYLSTILSSEKIRYHLHDLVLNWFGSIPDPTNDEWLIIHRILLNEKYKYRTLQSMYGNSGWFEYLRENMLSSWLCEEEINDSLLLYLISVAELNETQLEVFSVLQPFIGKSEEWNKRLKWIVSRIRKWHSCEAVEFFKNVIFHASTIEPLDLFTIGEISKSFSKSCISILRLLLDYSTNKYIEKKSEIPHISISDSLRFLENSNLQESFHFVSKAEPKFYLETMLPWLLNLLSVCPDIPDVQSPFYFVSDQLSWGWYDIKNSIEHAIIFSIIESLVLIGKTDSQFFNKCLQLLSTSPYQTPQLILIHVFQAIAPSYTGEALSFLLADRRRLDLGDIDSYDSRQLIYTIYPHLSIEERNSLEEFILQPPLINYEMGVEGLKRRGIKQLFLLQTIPYEHLSKKAIKQLNEWEHKFPGEKPAADPKTIHSGWVGSPIPEEIARKMTDKQWIKAINKYHHSIVNKDFLKGGSRQLSTVLQSLIKENPERYFKLLQRTNDDIDDDYVQAFINGFAESSATSDFLIYSIKRFCKDTNRRINRTIAWAIEKRANNIFPSEIIDLLQKIVRDLPGEDEWWWEKGENHGDVYSSFLNSDRGASFSALMRIYDNQKSDTAINEKWNLIELIENDPSTALRIGAIQELIFMIKLNREKATKSFMNLINGHEILYKSNYVREFLYWDLYLNYLQIYPYIIILMKHSDEETQERGAQLACIAEVSKSAMESENALQIASDLANKTTASDAPIFWKRGAAFVYSHNMNGNTQDMCSKKLINLLNEEDIEIHNSIGRVFYSLQPNQFFDTKDFISAYAQKTRSIEHKFSEYLLENGLLDPIWTLEIIRLYINNPLLENSLRHIVFEDIIRLTLRIYMDPSVSSEIRITSMDLFDILVEKYPIFSQKILSEWDIR